MKPRRIHPAVLVLAALLMAAPTAQATLTVPHLGAITAAELPLPQLTDLALDAGQAQAPALPLLSPKDRAIAAALASLDEPDRAHLLALRRLRLTGPAASLSRSEPLVWGPKTASRRKFRSGAPNLTGHELWNVASLGTLERVERQKNLGTLGGLAESAFQGARSVSNVVSFGLQESIYQTQMREGPGVKSVLKGAGEGLVALTPYEESKTLITNWGSLDAAQRWRLGLTAVSKTAGLGAGATALGERALSAASMDELTTAAQEGMWRFGREMGTSGSTRVARYVYDVRVGRYRDLTNGRFVAQRDLPYPANEGFAYWSKDPPAEPGAFKCEPPKAALLWPLTSGIGAP